MRVLIVEDEPLAAERLTSLLTAHRPQAQVLAVIDTVDDTIAWLDEHPAPDLLLLDIHLADGESFDIFRERDIEIPVIFTTAHDQYAIRAFDVNSIDYLLKPIEPAALAKALDKYERRGRTQMPDWSAMLTELRPPQMEYQQRFLIKLGAQYRSLPIDQVAYIMAAEGLVFLVSHEGRQYPIDYKVEELAERLNPSHFFRINRKFIIHIDSITHIHTWFNSRLKLDLQPSPNVEVIVSRERVSGFKEWLGR